MQQDFFLHSFPCVLPNSALKGPPSSQDSHRGEEREVLLCKWSINIGWNLQCWIWTRETCLKSLLSQPYPLHCVVRIKLSNHIYVILTECKWGWFNQDRFRRAALIVGKTLRSNSIPPFLLKSVCAQNWSENHISLLQRTCRIVHF